MFDVADYTQDFRPYQSSASDCLMGFDEARDPAEPLAIRHNGPFLSGSQSRDEQAQDSLRSLSFFSGVIERDRKEARPSKKSRPMTFCLMVVLLLLKKVHPELFIEEPSVRGRVIGLSPRSRLRLQVRINRSVFKAGRVWFVTLTYPREFPAHCAAKDDLRSFLKRIARKWGKRGAIWRIENQKRGAPHFHLVLFLAAAVPEREFVEWVARSWHAVVGSGDENHLHYGSKTELFRSARGVASYCSKYVSKPESGDRVRLIEGRQWGREGDFPEERIDFVFEEKDFYRFWRILRRSRGLVGHVGPGGGHPWKNLFCPGLHDDWLRLATLLGGYTSGSIEFSDFYE